MDRSKSASQPDLTQVPVSSVNNVSSIIKIAFPLLSALFLFQSYSRFLQLNARRQSRPRPSIFQYG